MGWTSFERVVLHFRFRDQRRGLVCGFVILEASWGVWGVGVEAVDGVEVVVRPWVGGGDGGLRG